VVQGRRDAAQQAGAAGAGTGAAAAAAAAAATAAAAAPGGAGAAAEGHAQQRGEQEDLAGLVEARGADGLELGQACADGVRQGGAGQELRACGGESGLV